MIHPELRLAARFLPRGVASPFMIKLLRRLPVPSAALPAGITAREIQVDGTARVRVVGASAGGARPALLWIHGGGYVIGGAKQDDGLCARFAEALGVTVFSVEYRLAPEHPYPAPLDDCLAVFNFIHREAASLGVDPTRLAIGGQSAGGGLAAALVLRVHDLQLPAPVFQLLVYPMLDDRTVLRQIDDRHHRLWNPASNRLGWSSYLAQSPGADGVSPYAAASRRESAAGLPPAWIGVGTCDLFHDEDIAYANKLREAGVSTTLEIVEGAFHGFDALLPRKPVSQRFFASQIEALRQALR